MNFAREFSAGDGYLRWTVQENVGRPTQRKLRIATALISLGVPKKSPNSGTKRPDRRKLFVTYPTQDAVFPDFDERDPILDEVLAVQWSQGRDCSITSDEMRRRRHTTLDHVVPGSYAHTVVADADCILTADKEQLKRIVARLQRPDHKSNKPDERLPRVTSALVKYGHPGIEQLDTVQSTSVSLLIRAVLYTASLLLVFAVSMLLVIWPQSSRAFKIALDPAFAVQVAKAGEFTRPSRQLVIENAAGDTIEVVKVLDTETVRLPGYSEQCDPGDLRRFPFSVYSSICEKAFREAYDWMGRGWVNTTAQLLPGFAVLIVGYWIAQEWISLFRHRRESTKELDPALGVQ